MNEHSVSSYVWLTQQLANTYADMAKRRPVRQATMQALGLSWLPGYTVRVIANTQLVEVAVVDTNPQRAQAVANELANQLIRQAPMASGAETDQRRDFVKSELDDLQVKIKETRDEISKKQSDLANLFSARQIADTQTQIAALQNKLTALQGNYAALIANTAQGAVNTLTVIEPAELPTVPVGPNRLATMALAAAIGLLLAGGAAYLLEYLDDQHAGFKVQIFGTDIDDNALQRARQAHYPQNIELDVSPARLQRFFQAHDKGYQVSRTIRDMVVFARQDLGKDPPFSRLDLISCRNVLIYLRGPLQRKVLRVFHYALRPEGCLLLGTSESVGVTRIMSSR
jgi:capsular polysaccharide biosynthesis protein